MQMRGTNERFWIFRIILFVFFQPKIYNFARTYPVLPSQDGVIGHEWREFSNVAFIMGVEHDKNVRYTVIHVSLFNLEYWRGNTQLADYTLSVTMH